VRITVTFEIYPMAGVKPEQFSEELLKMLAKYPGIQMVDFGQERRDRAGFTAEVRETAKSLVDLWNLGREKGHQIRLTEARVAKVQARLNDGFTAKELETVVLRLKNSEWHNGKNDRGWAASGPEWVLHTTEKVEQWLKKTEFRQKTYAEEIKDFFNRDGSR
jgi:hypothetical protein